jgi:predicted amidophosphoribosyltransferase
MTITCIHCRRQCPEGRFCQNCGRPLDKVSVFDPKEGAHREISLREAEEIIKSAETLKRQLNPKENP